MDIAGDIIAPDVTISGGDNIDFIQIRRPGTIDGSNSITVNGHAGDDRFFIQYADHAMTINGDDGSDRYFISSNAARSLFVTDNDYTEPADIFAQLDGNLADINAALTVHTGQGSAAGTVPDAIYASTSGSPDTSPQIGLLNGGSITGLGMTGCIDYVTPAVDSDGVDVLVGLGDGDDTFEVADAATDVVVYILGSGGNDTLDVGKTSLSTAGISGIFAFLGEDGSNDVLNVYGNAPAASGGGQLSAISVTGMEMGTNDHFTTHNDRFGADLSLKSPPVYPAAIYYANRDTTDNSIHSTVENVNVVLGNNADNFTIDSVNSYE
jgi:hypothetical protein